MQLYLRAPSKSMNKPALELKAFAKTNLLQPGKSQTISFTLTAADLASFDSQNAYWIADAGQYKVSIGASSQNIKSTRAFTVAKDIIVERDHKVLAPQVSINEMNAPMTY